MTTDRRSLYNDSEETFRLAFASQQAFMWTALPGIVTAVNLAKMTVSVQPAIQGVVGLEDGTTQFVNLPLLVDVPIVFPSAGGFTLTLPIAVNDECLVIFSSRCIDAWWQSSGVQKPMEARMHDMSDGFCIPGPRSQPKVLTGISATGAQLRNEAGTTYLEISANGKIKLVSPSEIDITGNLKVTGTITATVDVVAGMIPISLVTHTHTSASPGNPTGPPLP